jgi:predicted dehydrogenase
MEAQPGCVTRFGRDGRDRQEIAKTGRPNGLAVDKDGFVWVAESTSSALLRMTLEGQTEVIATECEGNPRIVAEDQAIVALTHKNGAHGWVDGHRFLDPNPDGPAMGDAFFEGEGGVLSIPATGDVYRDNILVWKNEFVAGRLGNSVWATLAHFISCLRSGAPFESEGRSYLRTFAAVEAAYRSLAERRCVSLSEVLDPGGFSPA